MGVGGDIIIGVLSSIVYEGIKRPYRSLMDTAARRRNINRALTPTAVESTSSVISDRPEIKDLAKILANDRGEYTESVANFLSEIQRSAIPDALKQLILCGEDVDICHAAFNLIYASHSPLPFECRNIFNALVTAIKTRVEQDIEEKTLFEAIKANSANLTQRIDALSQSLSNAKTIKAVSSQQSSEIRLKIAKGIEAATRQINVETNQGAKKISINKLVIPPRLAPTSHSELPSPHRDATSGRQNFTQYLSFRRSFNRALILGDPGGGKSTLTQLLCHDLANQLTLEASFPRQKFESRELVLPLRVIIRTLEKRQQKNASYSIFDYITDEIKLYCDNEKELATNYLHQALALGQIILIFDGLDEVLEVGSRRNMVAIIEQFCHAYATCPALITSRIVGYKDAPLSDEYDVYTLARLNKDEVKRFSEHLIQAVASLKKPEAKLRAAKFIAQTDKTAVDLRENPLLLGLMVYIFTAKGEVPNNRPEIYKECSLLMFEKWDQRRDIIYDAPQDFNLLDLFGFLASKIFGNAETEDGVSEEWLLQHLRTFFSQEYDGDRRRATETARVMVEFITGRAWVLCEIGPHVFKFTHRTFLEYFFARRLEEEAGSIALLVKDLLLPKILKSEWDVVSHLSLQIATFRSGPKSSQALDALLRESYESRFAPLEEYNFLSFVAKSLEYLTLTEAKMRETIEHIFTRAVHLGSVYNLSAREIMHDILSSTKRREVFVKEKVQKFVREILAGPSSNQRTFVVYLIGTRFAGYRSQRTGSTSLPSRELFNSFEANRAEAKDDQYARASLSVDEARSYLYVYRDNSVELYRRYRSSLLLPRSSELVPWEISAVHVLLISAATRRLFKFETRYDEEYRLTPTEAANFISLISDDFYDAWSSGTIFDVVGDNGGVGTETADELLFEVLRRPLEQPQLEKYESSLARVVFLNLLLMWTTREAERKETVRANIKRGLVHYEMPGALFERWPTFRDQKFGPIIAELIERVRAANNSRARRVVAR